jgi:hypothetical protein
MLFYLSIAAILFLLCPLDFAGSNTLGKSIVILKKEIIIFIGVSFIVLGGLRWLTGTDWENYYNFFDKNKSWDTFVPGHWKFEPGYTLLNYVIKSFSDSYTVFLLFFHFLVIAPKIITINKLSIYPFISLFFYFCFYFGETTAVRNALAASIALLSIPYIHKRNIKAFIVCTVIATSIHYSSAFWIFSYAIYHANIKKTTWFFLYLIALILLILGTRIYAPVIKLIFGPFGALGGIISKIIGYATTYKEPTATVVKQTLSLIKRVMFLPFFFIFFDKIIKQNEHNKGLLNLYLFGNAFYFCFFIAFQQMNRLIIAHTFLEVILLPGILCCFRSKATKMVMLFFFFAYGISKMISALSPFMDVLVPFYTIFNYQNRTMY